MALSVAVCAGGTAAGQAGPTSRRTASAENPYWAGYALTARKVSYTRVTGTWVVPTVACSRRDAGASSTVWVGLGGYRPGSKVLEQVGIDANCDASGRPAYYAWFELVPDVAHAVDETVSAGDTITGSVKMITASLVELRLENETRHWTFVRTITWGTADTSSAEWIVEEPWACVRFSCRQAPLADFGAVTFSEIAAVGNGSPGTLAGRGWIPTAIRLTPCVRRATGSDPVAPLPGARPGAPSADGRGFRVSWARDAGRPSTCGRPRTGTTGGLPDVTKG